MIDRNVERRVAAQAAKAFMSATDGGSPAQMHSVAWAGPFVAGGQSTELVLECRLEPRRPLQWALVRFDAEVLDGKLKIAEDELVCQSELGPVLALAYTLQLQLVGTEGRRLAKSAPLISTRQTLANLAVIIAQR